MQRGTAMTKLAVVLRNFANAPKTKLHGVEFEKTIVFLTVTDSISNTAC
jgi:hypothetical protein